MESSLREKPERHASRRLSDHLVLEGQKQKVHSLVDKVYSRKNLKLAWERVRANQGAGGTDGVTIGEFEADLDANLERLHRELREKTYRPQAVRPPTNHFAEDRAVHSADHPGAEDGGDHACQSRASRFGPIDRPPPDGLRYRHSLTAAI